MQTPDIRWQQRLHNYERALGQLLAAVALAAERELPELEQQGMIQAFKFIHELAWNVMKDFFLYQGTSQMTGSRDATRQAFAADLVADGQGWMDMIQSRNQSSHTYNRATALALVDSIRNRYAALFEAFAAKMGGLRSA